jgi:hypothetical protein
MRHHVACATWGHPDLAWVGERAVGLLRVGKRTYDPAMSRSMVGSVGTRQPAASRSQACRRACPAHDAGVHLRPCMHACLPWPRQQPLGRARTRAAGRGEGVKDVGVRPPNDGQAAADGARHDRQKTLSQRLCRGRLPLNQPSTCRWRVLREAAAPPPCRPRGSKVRRWKC